MIGQWDKEEVVTALKAAFWNADRAVEYLFNVR